MYRSSLLIGVVAMASFCTITAAFDLANDDVQDSNRSQPLKDIVIDTMHDYLREEEKRLAAIRKYLIDYSKEHKEATQNGSINVDKEIVEETDDYQYFSTQELELCRGETTLPAGIQKKLKCRYVDHGNPFLKIGPLKEEEAYLDPRIVVYHSVIYDGEIETLKRLSEPWLQTAKMVDKETGKAFASKQRIAKSAWIGEANETHVQNLNRRVEHLTGFTMDTAELLQVAYYEIGGLYLIHHDYIDDVHYFGGDVGNRISTVLFYMNDVEEGGATIFRELNVTIWPRKGSALFWYNLKQTGEGDPLSLHGACPVVSGTKWIVSKWIHEKGQEFRKPCSLLDK